MGAQPPDIIGHAAETPKRRGSSPTGRRRIRRETHTCLRERERWRSCALFDHSRRYRFSLVRRWRDGGPSVLFIMLNPSTADAEHNDPTVARCVAFARKWGFAALEVANLYALRSTDPRRLWVSRDPVGPGNDGYIRKAAANSKMVVAAWGIHGIRDDRGRDVIRMLADRPLFCLGLTIAGAPKHPLYLAGSTAPTVLEPRPVGVKNNAET